jgi:hypothetical protein
MGGGVYTYNRKNTVHNTNFRNCELLSERGRVCVCYERLTMLKRTSFACAQLEMGDANTYADIFMITPRPPLIHWERASCKVTRKQCCTLSSSLERVPLARESTSSY